MDASGPFAGLRVLDLCDEKGALAGKLLAGLGADVVLVEPPAGSAMRLIPPFWKGAPHAERSIFFWFYAAGKRSIMLDRGTAAGAARLRRLAVDADVVVTTDAPAGDDLRAVNPRERHEVQEDRALDVAEYFPGGGTDFETPLTAAVGCLRVARYRRGDVVLITDGECRVSPDWLARFRADKERIGFSLYSVLIDVGPSSLGTLAEVSDRVTAVSKLADEGVRDLFLRL